MFRLIRSFLLLVLIIALQAALYNIFIQPQILRWGASQTEADRAMPGDDLAPFISSTRAVTISAPAAKVWQWLVQLGADRSGFYSYRFLEEAMGYESRNSLEIKPEFQEMKVGRLVPGSMRESKSMIKYSWPVVSVDAGKSFVLKGWGCFMVESPGENQARLISAHPRAALARSDEHNRLPCHYAAALFDGAPHAHGDQAARRSRRRG